MTADSYGMIALNIPHNRSNSAELSTCLVCGRPTQERLHFVETRSLEDTNVTFGMPGRMRDEPYTLSLGCCKVHGSLRGNLLRPAAGHEAQYLQKPLAMSAGDMQVLMSSAGTFDILFQVGFAMNAYLVDEQGHLVVAAVKNVGLFYERWPARWPREFRKRVSKEGKFAQLLKPYSVMLLVGQKPVYESLVEEFRTPDFQHLDWLGCWNDEGERGSKEAHPQNVGNDNPGPAESVEAEKGAADRAPTAGEPASLDLGITNVEKQAIEEERKQREHDAWAKTPEGEAAIARRKRTTWISLAVIFGGMILLVAAVITAYFLGLVK